MLQLNIPERIHFCSNFKEIAGELNLTSGDLILTSQYLYSKHLNDNTSAGKIITFAGNGSKICDEKKITPLMPEIPPGIKRVIAFGEASIQNYAKLIRTKYYAALPLILISSICEAGNELLNHVFVQKESPVSYQTAAADAIYLYTEIPETSQLHAFIAGSIDTLIYASETFIHELATEHSLLFSREALRLLISNYRKIVFRNQHLNNELVRNFLLAGNYTGIARKMTDTSLLEPLYQNPDETGSASCHLRLLIFIHLFRRSVFTTPTGRIQEYLSYMASLLECSRSNVYPELLNLVKCILPPSDTKNVKLPPHLYEIENL